jgi:UDP-arabinose 4-epimerase
MNILVTGGAGYIGSHTSKLLKAQGHMPIAFDNLSRGWVELARFGPFVFGDIRNETVLYEALSKFQVDAVIHFAAKAYVEESTRMPGEYLDNNVAGTIALLKAMQRAGTKRLVFSSSCAVYGDAQTPTIREDHPKQPCNPYGLSKWQAEQVIATIAPVAGIHYAALRYFNVVGSDPDGEVYEKHEPETHVLPNLIRAVRTGAAFNLYGANHDTPDGTAVRDYVYVMDLAAAHIAAIKVLETQPQHISNVGTGSGTSVQELLNAVEHVLETRVNKVVHPIREGDPPRLVADNAHLRTWFQHDFSSLTQVIRGLMVNPPR